MGVVGRRGPSPLHGYAVGCVVCSVALLRLLQGRQRTWSAVGLRGLMWSTVRSVLGWGGVLKPGQVQPCWATCAVRSCLLSLVQLPWRWGREVLRCAWWACSHVGQRVVVVGVPHFWQGRGAIGRLRGMRHPDEMRGSRGAGNFFSAVPVMLAIIVVLLVLCLVKLSMIADAVRP